MREEKPTPEERQPRVSMAEAIAGPPEAEQARMPEPKKKGSADWWARTVAGLSLLLAFFNLWFTQLRPADIKIAVGPDVLVNQYSENARKRIGIICNFTNEGARQVVVTGATLKWDNPAALFKLGGSSPSLEQWEIVNGNREAKKGTVHTMFSPIVIKQRDQTTAILWFSSDRTFQFNSGTHTLTLEVIDSQSAKIASKQFVIELTAEKLEFIQKTPNDDVPVEVKSQL